MPNVSRVSHGGLWALGSGVSYLDILLLLHSVITCPAMLAPMAMKS